MNKNIIFINKQNEMDVFNFKQKKIAIDLNQWQWQWQWQCNINVVQRRTFLVRLLSTRRRHMGQKTRRPRHRVHTTWSHPLTS